MVNCESPGRAKDIKAKDFRPFGALTYDNSYQGFAALTPVYFLIAPAGARNRFFLRTVSSQRGIIYEKSVPSHSFTYFGCRRKWDSLKWPHSGRVTLARPFKARKV
jgi:hypothetical protein